MAHPIISYVASVKVHVFSLKNDTWHCLAGTHYLLEDKSHSEFVAYVSLKGFHVWCQGRSETPSNQVFEGVKFITTVNSSNIYNFLFYSRECHTVNVTDLSLVFLLVSNIYKMENKHLLGTYAVVDQVTLLPKEVNHKFVAYDDLVRTIWWVWVTQVVKIFSSSLNMPKNERKTENRAKTKVYFLALGDLVRSCNKIFIKCHRFLLRQQQTW